MRNTPTIYDKVALQGQRGRALLALGCWPQDVVATSIEGRQRIVDHLEAVCRAQNALMQEHPQRYDYSAHNMAWKQLVHEREQIEQLKKRGFDRPAYQPSIVGLD